MSSPVFLSRARLRSRRGEALASIAPLLIPDDKSRRAGHAHRILWMLFQDIPESPRDFLWRDEGEGRYMILSQRPPTDPRGLFEIDSKVFDPDLQAGDRLRFALRANPVRSTKAAAAEPKPGRNGKLRGKRVDVVMDALHTVPRTDWHEHEGRAFERDRVAAETCREWLERQGERAGFRVLGEPEVNSYVQIPVERRKGRPAGFSQVDLSGRIEITNSAAFLARLPLGFGSAKAFGCGLMLIRRA